MLTLGNKFQFLSISHKTWFEKLLVSFTTLQVAFIVSSPQSKTDNLCQDISGFVVVLSFGDSERVD